MKAPELEEFLSTLPEPDTFIGKNIYVWGLGSFASLSQEGLAREKSINVVGFTVSKGYEVSNYTRGGGYVFGKRLFTPDEIADDQDAFVFACVFNPEAIKNIYSELDSLHIKHCHLDAAIFSLHKNELRKVYASLDDDRSREIYLSLLKHRANARLFVDGCASWDHLFVNPAFQCTRNDDVFVDCGAFVGDTIEKFIWQHDGVLKKIIAFEPDAHNRHALEKRMKRLREEWNIGPDKITVYPYGVSDKSSVSYIRRHDGNTGLGSSMSKAPDDNTEEVKAAALDDILTEKITFLKADVESYEYRMLLGAAKTIAKYKPRLAICIYHNPTDIYSIPLLVKELHPDYKLMIRHHSVKTAETVLYAW